MKYQEGHTSLYNKYEAQNIASPFPQQHGTTLNSNKSAIMKVIRNIKSKQVSRQNSQNEISSFTGSNHARNQSADDQNHRGNQQERLKPKNVIISKIQKAPVNGESVNKFQAYQQCFKNLAHLHTRQSSHKNLVNHSRLNSTQKKGNHAKPPKDSRNSTAQTA